MNRLIKMSLLLGFALAAAILFCTNVEAFRAGVLRWLLLWCAVANLAAFLGEWTQQ